VAKHRAPRERERRAAGSGGQSTSCPLAPCTKACIHRTFSPSLLLISFPSVFPERPGALKRFLDTLHAGWNITLFHYRNHGSDTSKVLCAIQVPPPNVDGSGDQSEAFDAFLHELGYTYVEETENAVYKEMLA